MWYRESQLDKRSYSSTMEVLLGRKLLILVISCQALYCSGVEVSTPKGEMIGSENLKSRDGRTIYSFTNIPYAKPPIGELRFKESQPVEPWNETLNATKKITSCPAPVAENLKDKRPEGINQEDCLVLNVYSPKVDKSAHLPVMFLIHGGVFNLGSSRVYSPEFMLDKDIVLVTINYRLGALGFASTGDDVIPANLGLKDQALGLKWVHDNIEEFGGDPSKITVFGEDAGGVSSHMHLLSPMTKGLIHGGIASSGNAFVPWGLINPKVARERTKALAVLVDCPMEPSEEMLRCMQKTPVSLILQMAGRFPDFTVSPLVVFGPTIEVGNVKNPFLPAHPQQLESQIPLMTGLNSADGGVVASFLTNFGGRDLNEVSKSPEYYLPKILQLESNFPKNRIPEVTKRIKYFYFRNETISKSTIKDLVAMSTDGWILDGTVETATYHKGKVYLYYYDYEHSVSYNSVYGDGEVKGASLSDILLNLFPLEEIFPNRKWSESDIQVSKRMVDLWTNFAQTGKPIDSMPEWSGTEETVRGAKYLRITAKEPSLEENLLPHRVEFWRELDRLHIPTAPKKRSPNANKGSAKRRRT